MPYTHFTKDERIALQAMAGMRLAKCLIAVTLGKHRNSIYRELDRNSEQRLYAGAEARQQAEQRRLESKGRPKRDNTLLMTTVKKWFKKDYSPDQIAGRLKMEYPQQSEIQVSPETIYGYLYQEIKEEPELKGHFRYPRAERKDRGGAKDLGGGGGGATEN
jgi:IS30 family transposase